MKSSVTLLESFFMSTTVKDKYVEVFKNPDTKELVSLQDMNDDGSVRRNWGPGGSSVVRSTLFIARGLMTKTDLYVWSENAAYHEEVIRKIMRKLKLTRSDMTAVNLRFKPDSKEMDVIIAYSADHQISDRQMHAMARKHPAFKGWKIGNL